MLILVTFVGAFCSYAQPFGKLAIVGSLPENFDYSQATIFVNEAQIGSFQVSGTFYPKERLKGELMVVHPLCDTFQTDLSLKKDVEFDVNLSLKLEVAKQIISNLKNRMVTECGEVYEPDSVDELAMAPENLKRFLAEQIRYPQESIENYIQGTVYTLFIVSETGTIECVHLVVGVSPEINAEALRVAKLLPQFTPAKKNGKNVSSFYSLPIKFKLM